MRTVAALPQTVTLFTAPPAARSLTVTDVIVPMSVIFCDWKLPSACCVRIFDGADRYFSYSFALKLLESAVISSCNSQR